MPNLILKPQWFQILLALADHARHGLGIRNEVLRQTDNQMRLWPATLYGSLKAMVREGLIEEREGPGGPGSETDRRKFYGITRQGRRALSAEAGRMTRYVQTAKSKKVAIPR